MRLLAPVLFAVLVAGSALTSDHVVRAESDDGRIEAEHSDVAVPGEGGVPADTRPAVADSGTMTVLAAPAGLAIEDFKYDELELEGTASEVCAGRLLTGTSWAFREIIENFGGTAGSMYVCRERWDAANDPDCNGTVVNPVTQPNFESGCWSNHAQGRALDVMVGGSASSGYNRQRGINIVNWLLAPDANGNVNSIARRMGVQQILFADRCWNSEGDRGIATWNEMRECGIGHFDHVHVDMTINGANGQVSYWGNAMEPPAPKYDTQVFYDLINWWRQAVSWWNMQTTDEEGLAVPAGYTRSLTGDWDSNGEEGETFLWNPTTGDYIVQDWSDGDSLNARMGRLAASNVVAGDFDADGEFDDMLFYSDSGDWRVWSWDNFEPRLRTKGRWADGIDRLTVGDFDGDGFVNDLHIWDAHETWWNVFSFYRWHPTFRSQGSWSVQYDELIVGDFNAGGERNESLLWERHSGAWLLFSWENGRPRLELRGKWSQQYDFIAPGDYDTDGRIDDVFVYDRHGGTWFIGSFHRNELTIRQVSRWLLGYHIIAVGPFNE